MPISTVYYDTKIRLTMLCLRGFELYSRWVPLILNELRRDVPVQNAPNLVPVGNYSRLLILLLTAVFSRFSTQQCMLRCSSA